MKNIMGNTVENTGKSREQILVNIQFCFGTTAPEKVKKMNITRLRELLIFCASEIKDAVNRNADPKIDENILNDREKDPLEKYLAHLFIWMKFIPVADEHKEFFDTMVSSMATAVRQGTAAKDWFSIQLEQLKIYETDTYTVPQRNLSSQECLTFLMNFLEVTSNITRWIRTNPRYQENIFEDMRNGFGLGGEIRTPETGNIIFYYNTSGIITHYALYLGEGYAISKWGEECDIFMHPVEALRSIFGEPKFRQIKLTPIVEAGINKFRQNLANRMYGDSKKYFESMDLTFTKAEDLITTRDTLLQELRERLTSHIRGLNNPTFLSEKRNKEIMLMHTEMACAIFKLQNHQPLSEQEQWAALQAYIEYTVDKLPKNKEAKNTILKYVSVIDTILTLRSQKESIEKLSSEKSKALFASWKEFEENAEMKPSVEKKHTILMRKK